MRACTKTMPSSKVMAAANSANATSAVSASVHSHTAVTVAAPKTSDIARQPNGLSPNIFMLAAISILASGGCSGCSISPLSSHCRAVGTYQVSSKYTALAASKPGVSAASETRKTSRPITGAGGDRKAKPSRGAEAAGGAVSVIGAVGSRCAERPPVADRNGEGNPEGDARNPRAASSFSSGSARA